VVTTVHTPTARYGTAMAFDSACDMAVLFGGSDETDAAFDHAWEYDGAD
jgi:hypothetical protein